ncbi:MAG TPA: hypothetical protein VF704_07875 [Allosphingosinicella sp.]|jgi:microcompartment protein CcmK/EutM
MARLKVPKRVAGVKIPKKVRKKANRAIRLAGNPVVREVAAAAVGAAAAKADRGAAGAAARTAMTDPERFVETLKAAVLDGFQRFLDGVEDGLRSAADSAAEAGDPVAPPQGGKRRAANGSSGRAAQD